uniref:Uncharacterized protein n=1 Tax=Romanomermis culicivorax TaxID=13658 RepID=A0A915J4Z5_ROMCU
MPDFLPIDGSKPHGKSFIHSKALKIITGCLFLLHLVYILGMQRVPGPVIRYYPVLKAGNNHQYSCRNQCWEAESSEGQQESAS